MICDVNPDPGPGLVSRALPHEQVAVLDPTGQHRFFHVRRYGTRFAMAVRGETVWSVCVSIDGRDYVVPPAWIHNTAGEPIITERTTATLIAFPRGGRAAAKAPQ